MSDAYPVKGCTWLITLFLTALLSACTSVTEQPNKTASDVQPVTDKSPQTSECAQTEPAANAVKESQAIWPTPACPKAKPKKCPVCAAAIVANKPVLGEYELVTVDPPGFSFLARIDTGATSTAIHASEVTRFERDGQKWVRFQITNPDDQETVTLERELARRVRIKQTEDVADRRLLVMMTLRLGDIERQVEVSLANRSNMEFPLLIGRNFLLDTALVDVSLRRAIK